jgi:adenylate cyclase
MRTAATVGLATGAIGVLVWFVPALSSLEDSLGLGAFFRLRGPLPSPPGVVVVSIDEEAAAQLNLKVPAREWPRAYHARLIDRLVEQDASVIAFDLQFFLNRAEADDQQLAAAIRRSGRVVLVQLLERLPGSEQDNWREQDPLPVLVEGAAGLAPVPMPYTTLVSWFWPFLAAAGGEDVPTLPFVTMQIGAPDARAALAAALKSAGVVATVPRVATAKELRDWMRELRLTLKGNTAALSQVSARLSSQPLDSITRQRAQTMAEIYAADSVAYLNFYGPPGSVCTVPYDVVFEGNASPCPLKGAAVLVGVGRSRLEGAEEIDTYHTVYDQGSAGMSGVELHATALANMLTGTTLRPFNPTATLALLLGVGAAFGASAYWVRTRRRYVRGSVSARLHAAAVVVMLASAYCLTAYLLFTRADLVLPIVVPVAVQVPAALVLGLLVRPFVHEQEVRAVCLVADASGSTAVGQRLAHDAYARLMTEYTQTLARAVTERGGLALAPQGDGFLSLWVGEGRSDACLAALDMVKAAGAFNDRRAAEERLPLRIGLTVGAVTIRTDADRGAFEAFGDAVNVAARLQRANRELGTTVLASAEVVAGFGDDLPTRRVDVPPVLEGVSRPPDVLEVLPRTTQVSM